MTKIGPGMAEIQAKTCGRHISLAKVAMRIYFLWRRKATATRFRLYFCHPWMDLNHFFNFENPISIFYKFCILNIFIQPLWKELQYLNVNPDRILRNAQDLQYLYLPPHCPVPIKYKWLNEYPTTLFPVFGIMPYVTNTIRNIIFNHLICNVYHI